MQMWMMPKVVLITNLFYFLRITSFVPLKGHLKGRDVYGDFFLEKLGFFTNFWGFFSLCIWQHWTLVLHSLLLASPTVLNVYSREFRYLLVGETSQEEGSGEVGNGSDSTY